jgi:hypothetical protein
MSSEVESTMMALLFMILRFAILPNGYRSDPESRSSVPWSVCPGICMHSDHGLGAYLFEGCFHIRVQPAEA